MISYFLFVRYKNRESHSHGAYQDYIIEVGASEVISVDNWKTHTVNKWEATSRNTMTKQRKFIPQNQNQSKVERRIQYGKHKPMLVLRRSADPLIFWCYAIIFLVDFSIILKISLWVGKHLQKCWMGIRPIFIYSGSRLVSHWVITRFHGMAW